MLKAIHNPWLMTVGTVFQAEIYAIYKAAEELIKYGCTNAHVTFFYRQ